jgi:hypothetical protein
MSDRSVDAEQALKGGGVFTHAHRATLDTTAELIALSTHAILLRLTPATKAALDRLATKWKCTWDHAVERLILERKSSRP